MTTLILLTALDSKCWPSKFYRDLCRFVRETGCILQDWLAWSVPVQSLIYLSRCNDYSPHINNATVLGYTLPVLKTFIPTQSTNYFHTFIFSLPFYLQDEIFSCYPGLFLLHKKTWKRNYVLKFVTSYDPFYFLLLIEVRFLAVAFILPPYFTLAAISIPTKYYRT